MGLKKSFVNCNNSPTDAARSHRDEYTKCPSESCKRESQSHPSPSFRNLTFGRVEEIRLRDEDGQEVTGGLFEETFEES